MQTIDRFGPYRGYVSMADDRSRKRPLRRQRGFTLIEVLAVAALIALASAAVALSLPSGVTPGARAADTLTGALAEAARHAVIAGTPVGITIDGRGYRFYRGFRGRWQPLFGNAALAPRQWPSGVSLRVQRAGLDLSVDDDLVPEGAVVPAIRFEPTGQATPVTLILTDAEGTRRRIAIAADAAIDLLKDSGDAAPRR